jgi:hypothetical protein
MAWTEASTGNAPDFLFAYVSAERESTETDIFWMITAPYSEGQLQLPTLPVESVDLNFQTTDDVYVEGVFALKSPGGYDAARPLFHSSGGFEELFTTSSGSVEAYIMFANAPRPTSRHVGGRELLQQPHSAPWRPLAKSGARRTVDGRLLQSLGRRVAR